MLSDQPLECGGGVGTSSLSIFVRLEQPSLDRGGGLRHNLSSTYNIVVRTLPKQVDTHSYLGVNMPLLGHVSLTTHLMGTSINWLLCPLTT